MNQNREIYDKLRNNLLEASLSNSNNYDKAILTLSSASLGLSLSFIRDIVPFDKIINYNILLFSWFFFLLAIIVTIISFVFSQWGIRRQLEYAEKYYLENNKSFFNKKNIFKALTTISNHISGFAFIVALILTIIFVSTNITNLRGEIMCKNENNNMNSDTFKTIDHKNGLIEGGSEIPKMVQKVDTSTNETTKGAEIPNMAPIAQSPSGNQGEGGNSNNSNEK